MFHGALVLVWRLAVLAAIVALAVVTTFYLYPFIDNRVPALVAILIFYGLVAYGIIPLIIRLFRLLYKPNHVPTHVTTPDGWASDPVNVAVTARSKRHLIRAMKASGWHVADEHSLANTWKEFVALVLDQPYPTAPCSHLYMFGRHQDIAFQIPVGNSPRVRHHVRFWKVRPPMSHRKDSQHHFWWQTLRKMTGAERELWVGAATFDKSFLGLRWRNLQFTHSIDANTNEERDFVINSLHDSRFSRKRRVIQAGEPYSFRGQNFGATILSDGTVHLVELRRARLPLRPKRTNDR